MEDFNDSLESITVALEEVSKMLPEELTTEFEAKAVELANRVAQHIILLETSMTNSEDIEVFLSSEEVDNLALVLEEVADLLDLNQGEKTELEVAVTSLIELVAEHILILEALADLSTDEVSEEV